MRLMFAGIVVSIDAMITFLEGTLVEALPTQITISVQGVGYQVFIPLSSFDKLPLIDQSVKILTHLQVREDAHILYGFGSPEERDLFRLLINRVSGVGPKIGLAVLSGMSVSQFKSAVVNGDVASLSQISGLGKKTAERIILELKDKVGVTAAWEAAGTPDPAHTGMNDAVLALISLGYKQVDAHKAIKKVLDKAGDSPTSETLIRLALQMLA